MKIDNKSAFMLNLALILTFFIMGGLSAYANYSNINATAPTGFFFVAGIVLLIILPKCSTKN